MSQEKSMYTVYTDGGSRGNPGPAAYGFVVYDDTGALLLEHSEYIGHTTNNQAEYQGIVAAMETLKAKGWKGVISCKLDSELVVRQINGIYKMKNADLKPWLDKVKALATELGTVNFEHIYRENNKEADRLVNKALDAAN